MVLSRVGGTSKMLRGVHLLARRLRAAEPSRKVCAALVHATNCCIEDAMGSLASLGFTFTEASKCTHGRPARGHHPDRPAAGEAWCVSTKPHCVFVQSHSALLSTNRRDHQRET